jgi:hypothetical protein
MMFGDSYSNLGSIGIGRGGPTGVDFWVIGDGSGGFEGTTVNEDNPKKAVEYVSEKFPGSNILRLEINRKAMPISRLCNVLLKQGLFDAARTFDEIVAITALNDYWQQHGLSDSRFSVMGKGKWIGTKLLKHYEERYIGFPNFGDVPPEVEFKMKPWVLEPWIAETQARLSSVGCTLTRKNTALWTLSRGSDALVTNHQVWYLAHALTSEELHTIIEESMRLFRENILYQTSGIDVPWDNASTGKSRIELMWAY